MNFRYLGLVLTVFSIFLAGEARAQKTLLNVSYDPTREFYADYNAAFAKYWKVKAGQDGFRTRTARGGNVSASECGCPCHGVGSAHAPPSLPRLLPPYSPASLLISSR